MNGGSAGSSNDSSNDLLLQVLRKEESLRLDPYKDSFGFWTIGYGCLIDRRKGGKLPKWIEPSFPITLEDAEELLRTKVIDLEIGLGNSLAWWFKLNAVRRTVLLAMAFQLGIAGVLKFTGTLAAIADERWDDAYAHLLNSLWARQTPARAQRMATAMRTGDATAFGL